MYLPFIESIDQDLTLLPHSLLQHKTDKVEEIQKDAHDLKSIRQKVESFDLKNAGA